jgi:phosphatidylglycerophosphatase A
VTVFRPSVSFAFSHPAHAVALGFGAGLAPFAPGTFGTALAWALAWAMGGNALLVLGTAIGGFLIGIWACQVTGRHMGMEDHGALVWDEIVAFLLVLAIVPAELGWQAAAFVAFRVFDIAKPPPIRHLERRYGGGFGVMFDDLVAAGYTLLLLAVAQRFLL